MTLILSFDKICNSIFYLSKQNSQKKQNLKTVSLLFIKLGLIFK